MSILKKTSDYILNEGSLMANGLFNILEIDSDGKIVDASAWFGVEVKDSLLELSDELFDETCKQLVSDAAYML